MGEKSVVKTDAALIFLSLYFLFLFASLVYKNIKSQVRHVPLLFCLFKMQKIYIYWEYTP